MIEIDEKILEEYRKYYKEDDPIIEKYRKYFEEGTPDIVIAAEARFIDDGEGLVVYKNDKELHAALKKEQEEQEKDR